jgi:hypothetical protein
MDRNVNENFKQLYVYMMSSFPAVFMLWQVVCWIRGFSACNITAYQMKGKTLIFAVNVLRYYHKEPLTVGYTVVIWEW